MAVAEVKIPESYKGAVYDEPGKVSTKVEELKTPEPGPGEVLINLYGSVLSQPILQL
jgi:alcohol dehydrogenase, propanol-preferring